MEVFEDIGLVKLKEEDVLLSALLGGNGIRSNIVAVYENQIAYSDVKRVRFLHHKFSSLLTAKQRPLLGAKTLFSWHCTSRDRVIEIITHGFSFSDIETNGLHGIGIYLHKYAVGSGIMSMTDDKDGLRHLLLCSLIAGNMEEIHPGSKQSSPSSDIYDSGVDSLALPKKYVIWCTNMNSNIWPLLVVSFKFPCGSTGIQQHPTLRHVSPELQSALKSRLIRLLPPDIFSVLLKYCIDYKENRISQQDMEQFVKPVVRVYLFVKLIEFIKSEMKGHPSLASALVSCLPPTISTSINKYYRLYQEKKLSEQQMEQHLYVTVGNHLLVCLAESKLQ